jgi:ADP-ribose pyrophosphatase YjhB (NUDIX family)
VCIIVQEFAMSAASAAFNSVKLPSALVIEARQTALAMRRSTAGQIEYWAMLGKAVEDGGLTAREAAQALTQKTEVSQAQALLADFVQFDASGQLAQHVRQAIASNAAQAHRMAA